MDFNLLVLIVDMDKFNFVFLERNKRHDGVQLYLVNTQQKLELHYKQCYAIVISMVLLV